MQNNNWSLIFSKNQNQEKNAFRPEKVEELVNEASKEVINSSEKFDKNKITKDVVFARQSVEIQADLQRNQPFNGNNCQKVLLKISLFMNKKFLL